MKALLANSCNWFILKTILSKDTKNKIWLIFYNLLFWANWNWEKKRQNSFYYIWMDLLLFGILKNFSQKKQSVFYYKCWPLCKAIFDVISKVLKKAIDLVWVIFIEYSQICYCIKFFGPVFVGNFHVKFSLIDYVLEIYVAWKFL